MQSIATNEEVYEMTLSHSERLGQDYGHEDEEEANLLDKEDSSEDEEWTIIVENDEQPELQPDNPLMRYICLAVAIGISFIVVKILLTFITHEHPMRRPTEKLYYNGSDYFASTVILISLDGFRPDYLERNVTPHLNELANDGIKAKYIHPAFPPSTFPNHWTLITGLYPETHGIVGNTFYDPDIGLFEHANATITSDHRWWKGEPIWLTSRRHRQKTASIMWPGCNTHHDTPDYIIPFNNSMEMKEKMQATIDWLDLPYDKRPQMISVYIQQVDQEGHRGGPDSPKMNGYIQEVDNAIGFLTSELAKRSLDTHAHIVVVSDHGMSSIGKDKLIYYDNILPLHLLKYVENISPSSILHFQRNISEDIIQEIYHHLANYTQTHHFQVYLQKDMPNRFHYKHSNRIAPIQVIPDIGYTFVTHKTAIQEGGDHHGYDNLAEDMRAIFLAKGPKLNRMYKEGTILAPFFNIEVYGFMAELLNIDAAPNNGTIGTEFPIIYQPPF
ncbi:hypothetical protein G6F37_006630 [Rhizopus arrhizus]|nr:hypothetical protein G6F38_006770 [Rhizopus arrhizus]KAG1157517.1 hypothetical protein G6F37_006630 [Rhizopus arrhizus]